MANFDFTKYDVGGWGARAGDGLLSGAEVTRARKDGWLVFDCYDAKKDGQPKYSHAVRLEAYGNESKIKRIYNDKEHPVTATNCFGKKVTPKYYEKMYNYEFPNKDKSNINKQKDRF